MNLMEYQAREIFEKYNIGVMKGVVVETVDNLEPKTADLKYPLVIKAQIRIGGRGKAGGIQFANDFKELKEHYENLLGSSLKGHKVNKLLIVEKADYKMELYLSIIIDRTSKKPMIIFSKNGGVDIEETALTNPDLITKLTIDPFIGIRMYDAIYLINKAKINADVTKDLYKMLTKLYEMVIGSDALLAEINPLILTENDELIALDGKVSIDDSGLYRQKEIGKYKSDIDEKDLRYEAEKHGFLYIPIDNKGNISVISNGSGMIMSTIDLLSKKDLKVFSALDLGGGATADRLQEAIRIVFSEPNVKHLYINIFGGITRCDEIANGIKNAIKLANHSGEIVVRIEGTNKLKGINIIKTLGDKVIYVDGLQEGVNKIAERR